MTPIDRVVEWGTRQRVPWWVLALAFWFACATVFVGLAYVGGVGNERGGEALVGSFYGVWGLVTYGALTRAADRAMTRFRPALAMSDAEVQVWRTRITRMPTWAFITVAAIAVYEPVLIATGSLSFTESGASHLTPLWATLTIAVLSWAFGYVVTVAAVWQIVSVAVNVERLHRRATKIDIFRLAPAHAFAPVTAGAGASILIVVSYGVATYGDALMYTYVWGSLLAMVLVAIGVFAVPLLGMRRRLEDAKDVRMAAVTETLDGAAGRMRRAAEAGDDAAIAPMRETIGALKDEVDRVKSVPTWPWNGRTVRGFATTTLLPVVTYVITAVVGRVLDL